MLGRLPFLSVALPVYFLTFYYFCVWDNPQINLVYTFTMMGRVAVLSGVLMSLAAACAVSAGAATYYISDSGDDGMDGRTPARAIRTLGRLQGLDLHGGDSLLFARGGEWRGALMLRSGDAGAPLVYGAYGAGAAPVLKGSILSSEEADWVFRDGFWVYGGLLPAEVGNIIFEGGVGRRRWRLEECVDNLDFHYDVPEGVLRVKAAENPVAALGNVEIALNRNVVTGYGVCHVVVCDLAICYGAAHGIQLTGCSHVEITRNEISWIGGGTCPGMTEVRYGNGVELWGGNDHISVTGNHIHDIYDTGVTNQNHSSSARQEHILYAGNVIERCGMYSFEMWNNGLDGSTLKDVAFVGNECRDAGGGWGRQRPDIVGYHINWGAVHAETVDIVIADNTFIDGNGLVLGYIDATGVPPWYSAVVMRDNIYSIGASARHKACYLFCDNIDKTYAFGIGQREACEAFCGVRLGVEGQVRNGE